MSVHATSVLEHAEMIGMARDLARRELAPRAAALDAGEESALTECWGALVDVGLDRALLGEELGGAGIGLDDLLAVLEELAWGDGGVALSVLLCNAALSTLPPEMVANVPVGARWALVPAASAVETEQHDGRPAGTSVLGLGAWGADGILIAFRDGRLLSHAAGAAAPGLQIEREQAQLGLRGAPAATVRMDLDLVDLGGGGPASGEDGAAVGGGPASGEDDAGGAGAGSFALLRLGIAAIASGIARRAHQLAQEYALERRQGGVAIIEHDAVRDMLGAMVVRLRSHACTGRAAPAGIRAPSSAMHAGAGAEGTLDPVEAIVAKVTETDAAVATSTDAVQVFGGTGYMRETGVEKLMRDAKCCQLFPEPNWVAADELMRMEIAAPPWRGI